MIEKLRTFAERYLLADAAPLSRAERWRSTIAAFAGILLIEAILTVMPGDSASRQLLAPLGASSVILFALPHSPLGQPWPSAGGLALSALIGMLCHVWIQPAWLAVALALAASVWLMASLRCIHPPGGAMAVLFASGFGSVNTAVDTILINILAVLLAALAVNAAIPGRRWPQCFPETPGNRPEQQQQRPGINHDDLQYALGRIDGFLDITEDDLIQVYEHALNHACERHEKRLCGEIMTRSVISVSFGTSLNDAWTLLRQHHLKALPVVDRGQFVLGMISADDFLHHVNPDSKHPIADNIRRLLRYDASQHSNKPEVVGQIMSPPVIVAKIDDPISRVAYLLSGRNHHSAVPVVDSRGKLAGMLGQTDLLAALYHLHATTLAAEKSVA
ncbi:CBS domain-containing protein [Azonexus sp.]|uniref:HPP family protein n=1 Tax=Azonexus sp. TaxID=1872668 RepID=UPI0027B9EA10|nr:CBS domain-containing protein [Azonexus sp.]